MVERSYRFENIEFTWEEVSPGCDADIEDATDRLRALGEKKQRLNAELEQLRRIAQDG